MITYKLHLIRHGLTALNLDRRYVGCIDEPLCPEGIAQIKKKLAESDYPEAEAVYCCPLTRSRETAEILYPDSPVTVVEDLIEMSMGDFEGRSFDELKSEPAFVEWMSDSANNAPPGGENSLIFGERISQGLNAVFMDMQREKIREAVCVVSGGVIMSLLTRHTHSDRPLSAFSVKPAEGYSIGLSTQFWAAHRLIVVEGSLPTVLG